MVSMKGLYPLGKPASAGETTIEQRLESSKAGEIQYENQINNYRTH